ncbi:MAG TPA: hypothetical protein DIS94_04995, partial [Bacteroidetes bacterium]|nr:hypothetical protein [Bacteroidota bacterium]
MEKKFSLIIPTLDRYEYLKNLLLEITTQTILPDEIIIVDQSNIEDSKLFLEFLYNYDLKRIIKYLKIDPQGSGRARNIAVSIALNEYLLFIDDDIELRSNTIFASYIEHLNNERIDIIEGAYLDHPNRKIERFVPDFKHPNVIFTFLSTYFNKQRNLRPVIGLCAGNFACKKSVFVDVGGFDQRYGQSDDIDFGLRVWKFGYIIINDKSLRVFHFKARSEE